MADGDDSIGILVSKGSTALQRDRDIVLGAGDGVALLSQEPADVAFCKGPILIVSVPRATLEECASNVRFGSTPSDVRARARSAQREK